MAGENEPRRLSGEVLCSYVLQSELLHMSEAIRRIIGAYVKLGNRNALEDMRGHRHRLATKLKASHGTIDLTSSIKLFEEEIAFIEEGIAKLDAPPPTWAAALDLVFPPRAA